MFNLLQYFLKQYRRCNAGSLYGNFASQLGMRSEFPPTRRIEFAETASSQPMILEEIAPYR
jgi:hypothetical protein